MTQTDGIGAGRPADAADWRLSVSLGRADEIRAEVLVAATRGGAAAGLTVPRLTGSFTGPIRGRDVTLPTSVRLVDMPALARPLVGVGRAVFTEPAYWTPELPNLYRLEARIEEERIENGGGSGDGVAAHGRLKVDRMIGLRRLGVRGRSFWLDGRRWVVRGVGGRQAGFTPDTLRSLFAAAVLDDPDEAVCTAADRIGVGIVAWLWDGARPLSPGDAEQRLARLANHPAVLLAVVPRTCDPDTVGEIASRSRQARGTLLLGLEVDGGRPPGAGLAREAAGVDFIVVDLPDAGVPHEDWRACSPGMPLVARLHAVAGPDDTQPDAAALRRECDRLQAALATWGLHEGAAAPARDWSGYLVTRGPGSATSPCVSRS